MALVLTSSFVMLFVELVVMHGFGGQVCVHFDRLSGTISVVLLELCPNRV